MNSRLEAIRVTGAYPTFVPVLAEPAHTDVPDESEATNRLVDGFGFKPIMTFEDETTTLGDILLCARTLEAAGHRVAIRFTRLGNEPTNTFWGITVAAVV